jgi:exodeoxyribonuclease VII large subunit
MPALTVSQLVETINSTLAGLDDVEVEGEVDEFKIIHNKWVTFQLKDANSSIGCFMTVWQYRTQVEDGMLVRVKGKPTLRNKGFFSFVLSSIQPSGEGALKRAFELLRQKLAQEGLFGVERKRPLPRFPQHVALITSRDAAAYSDFLKVLRGRQGGLTISFIHTQVQGEDAPRQLVAALEQANTDVEALDAIVLVRGGGSLEDLHAFNDETVIRAVAASRTPIIVGVGHERDITLAELAADVRASTPSNAAELLVSSRQELSLAVLRLHQQLRDVWAVQLRQHADAITHAVATLRAQTYVPAQRVARQLESLSGLRARLRQTVIMRREDVQRLCLILQQQSHDDLEQSQQRLAQLTRVLTTLSPEKTLRRGYTITRNAKGKIVTTAKQLKVGEVLDTQFSTSRVKSTVTGSDSQQSYDLI